MEGGGDGGLVEDRWEKMLRGEEKLEVCSWVEKMLGGGR